MEQTERLFRLLVQNVTDYAIFMLDPEGRVASWNPGAERITGYAADDILGEHFGCLWGAEDRDSRLPQQAMEIALRRGRYEKEGWRVRKGGAVFWASSVINPVHDDAGALIGFVKVMQDISLRHQLRQSQKMQAVGELASGMAHDFNNLLAVVIGSLDLLEERIAGDPVALEATQLALNASLKGAGLIRQLLAFSRQQTLAPKVIDVNGLVSGMIDLLRRTLGEQIEIRTLLAENLSPAVADPTQLESALVNLAINARDAMPKGGRLTIETANKRLDESYTTEHDRVVPGDYVMLAVSDLGVGISKDVLERVFEPFFTTKKEGRGTGLGLSMVYGFARQSGGHVRIYSEIGFGTTVLLYLPRAGESVEPDEPSLAAEAMPERAAILVVEDNAGVRRIAVRQLTELGYGVLEAESAESALALIRDRQRPIHLLFTDLIMPGDIMGDELARRARALRPDLRVLFTSGFAESPLRGEGREIGAGNLLTKPYRKAELATRVREALEGAAGAGEAE